MTFFKRLNYTVYFASAALKTDKSVDFSSIGVHDQTIVLNDESFDDFTHSIAPDIVVFDRFLTEEQFAWRVIKSAPHALRILDCEDLHCLREARQQAYKSRFDKDSFLDTAVPKELQSLDICKREIAAILRSDLSILLSHAEVKILQEVFSIPASHLLTLPFLERYGFEKFLTTVNSPTFDQRQDFVIIGSFKHAPNWDAVMTLKQRLWPNIRAQIKDAACHVYGSYLTPKAKALENPKQGFFVHGFTQDALASIASAKVMLAPINFGAGIKGKLIDAMQTNTPSITSPIGAEGIAEHSDWPGSVCANINEFVQQAVLTYQEQSRWQLASDKCSKVLKNTFEHEHLVSTFETKLTIILETLQQHRAQNFVGAMLLHHSMQSTKYMSQWIEAKSKLANYTGK